VPTPRDGSGAPLPRTRPEGGGQLGRTLDTGDYLTVHNVTDDDLGKLDPREREVVRLAFGLTDGEQMKYGAIGEKLGIGGERVRQIRNDALRKLQVAVNPDWPWPRGGAPEGWRLKDALDEAGFRWPVEHDWRPDQLPIGHDPGETVPFDGGLVADEIVPGLVTLRMDPLLLLRDGRVRNPPRRERMGISIFACVASADDRDETIWAALTHVARPSRVPIEREWRQGGNSPWRRGQLFLMDAGKWIGPRSAFAAAAWREAFNAFPERARLTADGLAAVRSSIIHP
jgi:DNA-binding CsgD family transcriptional regulator